MKEVQGSLTGLNLMNINTKQCMWDNKGSDGYSIRPQTMNRCEKIDSKLQT